MGGDGLGEECVAERAHPVLQSQDGEPGIYEPRTQTPAHTDIRGDRHYQEGIRGDKPA